MAEAAAQEKLVGEVTMEASRAGPLAAVQEVVTEAAGMGVGMAEVRAVA